MQIELGRLVDALPGFVWTALPDGQIEFLNQRWCGYTGLRLNESCGRGWQAAVHPEDLPRLLAGWRADPAPCAPVEAEGRLRGSDGNYRWVLFRAEPSAGGAGEGVKWCGLGTDIDARKTAEEARLAEVQRELQLTVDTLPAMVATYRPDGSRIFVNRTWLDYTGLSVGSAIDA